MTNGLKISIYGDSIMKGTLPDEDFHYHFTIKDYIERICSMFPVEIRNRAVFGSCISKGKSQLEKDLARADIGQIALLEFGGNDCNFHWDEIAREPEGEHKPYTPLETFISTLEGMAKRLSDRGIRPVLVSLPPIDSEKYLKYIGRSGNDCGNIMKWLGDVNMIYRFHELYSNAVEKLAFRKRYQLIDLRSGFLDKHNYRELISEDGIHPSQKGYELMFQIFSDALEKIAKPAAV